MAVPQSSTVLVIGAGPAGAYAACCLAREGIDTVLLEAVKFPRYHIGESTLPSLRHFFKFIDVDRVFDSSVENGALTLALQNGAVFRLNQLHPDACTDFIEALGPDGYAWNLIRSESDDLLFRHARTCGAHAFDETKVDAIQFEANANRDEAGGPGRPVSATWSRKDGSTGSITFDYLVDASGRNGILSTKYLRNRTFNRGLKNVASWGYWKSDALYGKGTSWEGLPYFEALQGKLGHVSSVLSGS
ncbi:FAD/NAD(P)-binding domain-containing protein [Ophiocordyceps camponoti-floridani]|uniref:FAD/NAD(P)-binding domain-containing protein n=1 Tax=Ophiocordyceps camponoti-floridani TaxID=2030778 RepID=A0A8H4VBM2_9HYPO|nr:FAD/NAD(P)-binding domain-containing protein [Ophiocordyceps camponoti-floridani]